MWATGSTILPTVTILLLLFRRGIHSWCCAFKICSYILLCCWCCFARFCFVSICIQITINNINKLSNHFTHLYIRRQVCGGCCSPCCRVAVNVNVMLYGWRESCVRAWAREREKEREQKRENSRSASNERAESGSSRRCCWSIAVSGAAAAALLLLWLWLVRC